MYWLEDCRFGSQSSHIFLLFPSNWAKNKCDFNSLHTKTSFIINRLQLKHQQSDNYHKHSSKNSLLSSGEPYSQEKAMVAEVTKQSRIESGVPTTKSTLPPSHSHPQVGRQQQLHATHSNTGKLLLDSIQKIYNIDPISGSIISLMNGATLASKVIQGHPWQSVKI